MTGIRRASTTLRIILLDPKSWRRPHRQTLGPENSLCVVMERIHMYGDIARLSVNVELTDILPLPCKPLRL
jgi:hypothetical protein